ncbi:MAG: cupin domain-containing protein, partial [Planctomycetota bacterium]
MTPPPAPFFLSRNGAIPNNPDLPILPLKLPTPVDVNSLRKRLQGNGWHGIWTGGIYDYHHYHSTNHEFLGVLAGSAELELGGQNGEHLQVEAGDALVLPAGTGHRAISQSPGFQVLGAYPGQADWDLCTDADEPDQDVEERIREVAVPKRDPLG